MTRILGRQTFGSIANIGNVFTPAVAKELLESWVPNIKLRNHMYQVGYLLKCWAKEKENLDETDQWRWQMTGWLHDADWEQWPELHCSKIIEYLEEKNIDPEIIHAIASHGPSYFGVDPISQLDKCLYAFDELSGFAHAYSLMRPAGYEGMEVKGFMKRLKDKTFAAQVNRDDIKDGAERLGIPIEELIQFVIDHQKNTPALS